MAKNIEKRSRESYLAKTPEAKRRQAKGLKQRWPESSKSKEKDHLIQGSIKLTLKRALKSFLRLF